MSSQDKRPIISQDGQHVSLLTDYDSHIFREGNHFRIYEILGSKPLVIHGVEGTYFAVWAPNAASVSVIGDFNQWNKGSSRMNFRPDGSGIWEVFIPGVKHGAVYKYHIESKFNDYKIDKGDPYAFAWQEPPNTASIVYDLNYAWQDAEWMDNRAKPNGLNAPVSIYEVHLGSWKRVPEENNRFLNYRELAHQLADYVKYMGFTHIELLPVMEHPYYRSWGYQVTGFFAPTSRYGKPEDFMYFVDHMHRNGIGVILDWVPSNFPSDAHGPVFFDGTHLYEHADTRQGFHPEWKTYIFNHGRNEVRNFLISNALFWLDKYHIDSLRVDAVASMLYLDYARSSSEWIPNDFGGKENIKSVSFIKTMNEVIYKNYPDVQTIAEESTSWSQVSRPVFTGGLGFGMKWNMGWMHDTLKYASKDPIYRKYHHNELTFSIWYAFYENFVLPLSHDEVVYGKGSLLRKMPGDEWQKWANLRLLFGYMFTHPGKKLLFMGGEFGQSDEWDFEKSLDWHLLQFAYHKTAQDWVRALNDLYKHEKALYELDFARDGFSWIDCNDWENSVISYIRKAKTVHEQIAVICNFTPAPRNNYRIGLPVAGEWKLLINSDDKKFSGSGYALPEVIQAEPKTHCGQPFSAVVNLSPLSTICYKSPEITMIEHEPARSKSSKAEPRDKHSRDSAD